MPQSNPPVEPIIGDVVFPERWTVFAPLKREDPLVSRQDLLAIPSELRVGDTVLKPELVSPTRGQVDFAPFFGAHPEGYHKTAYVFLNLKAERPGGVSLGFGWDYLLDMWLNGEPLLDPPEKHDPVGFTIGVDNNRITLELKAGDNILALRITGGGGPVILALAGPRELRRGDVRRILDDPARIDPAWNDSSLTVPPGDKCAVDIGERRELFVDEYLIDGLRGAATRRLHHPVPREVVMTFGRQGMPWEGNAAYPTLFRDEDRIRLYYSGRPATLAENASAEQYACLAESTDGIHFSRPELGLFDFRGSQKNNIVWHGAPAHNFTPFRDENPSAPTDQRYKAIGYHPRSDKGLAAFGSPDGIHWRLLHEAPIITEGAFDSQNLAFWDPLKGLYVEYHRGNRGARPGLPMLGLRDILTCASRDFIHWSEPRLIDYADAYRYHLYTNAILPYPRAPHLYIGTPARFMCTRKKIDAHPTAGVSDAMLMSSRDGVSFQRWNEGFIRPSMEAENWTDRNQYPAWGMLQLTPGEWSLYWNEHYKHSNPRLRRGTLRIDGFASLHAGGEGVGEVLTRPMVFSGRKLEINYATSAAGTMQFALCDEAGNAFDGFSLDDSEMLFGNAIDHVVTWRGRVADLGAFAGRSIRLRVRLQDADLYAIRFAP